jgi:hypothetical protein
MRFRTTRPALVATLDGTVLASLIHPAFATFYGRLY